MATISRLAPVNGILIYQLPEYYQSDALDTLPKRSFTHIKHDEVGLKIYFKQYDAAKAYIVRRNISVRGVLYDIYPLVTNLTVHGIRRHAKMSTVKKLVKHYGTVINSYPVEAVIEEKYKKVFLTDDYRIIMDVPEVLANFRLTPLKLCDSECQFQISFFCRLCRRNGHKQHQCSNRRIKVSAHDLNSRASVTFERTDTLEKSWGEYAASEALSCCKNDISSHHEIKHEISRKSEQFLKSNKEAREKSTKRLLESNESQKDDKPPKLIRHRNNSKPSESNTYRNDHKLTQSDKNHDKHLKSDKNRKDHGNSKHSKSNLIIDHCKTTGDCNLPRLEIPTPTHTITDKVSSKYVSPKPTLKFPDDLIDEKQLNAPDSPPNEDVQKEYVHQQLRKRVGTEISRMVPPDWSNGGTRKLLKTVFSFGSLNIPKNVEDDLRHLLEWNLGPNRHTLREQEFKMTRWLQLYLNKIEVARRKRVSNKPLPDVHLDKVKPDPKRQKEEVDLQSPVSAKKKICRRSKLPLSPGILEIISVVSGELNPSLLFNFLEQVRGRKRPEAVVEYFTTNTRALVDQLKAVVTAYYRSSMRGSNEEQDVRKIKCLYKKLEHSMLGQIETCTKKEDRNLACQPHEGFVKIEPSERFVKLESNERFLEIESNEGSVKIESSGRFVENESNEIFIKMEPQEFVKTELIDIN